MKNLKNIYIAIAAGSLLAACTSGGEFQGREFMPDMAHSIAYEANHNVYYKNNTWGAKEDYRTMAGPRKPVEGTVARNYMPYKYENLQEFQDSTNSLSMASLRDKVHTLASNDDELVNTVEVTEESLPKVLAEGKELYTIACSACHGEKGDGNGVLYNDGDGPYGAKPANYLDDKFITAKDGLFYDAIMNGKGVMQPHADKLNEEERWKVIHYIRSMQAKAQEKEYAPFAEKKVNTSPSETVAVDSTHADAAHGGH